MTKQEALHEVAARNIEVPEVEVKILPENEEIIESIFIPYKKPDTRRKRRLKEIPKKYRKNEKEWEKNLIRKPSKLRNHKNEI